MSREDSRAWTGAVKGAGTADDEEEVGSESDANDAAGDRGVDLAGGSTDEARGKDGGDEEDGVTAVERNAVSRGEDRTVTGTSSRMAVGTSLLSIKLGAAKYCQHWVQGG